MIGDIITILTSDAALMALVPSSNVFPIQRKQGTAVPAITVDMLDVRTSETKSRSSDLDFITIQVIAYDDNPQDSYTIASACRMALDNFFGLISGEQVEIRFDDQEMGIAPEDESFATVANYMITVTRDAQDRHH